MAPRVSVLIPCFDAADTVGDAIRSALAQTVDDVEILVLDDGSRDATPEVLRSFDGRIDWETQPHRGRNPARNRLLERSRGAWLQYLDADDVLLPGKLERQLAAAGDADLVVSPAMDARGRPLHAPRGGDPWQALLDARLGVTSSNLFRREAVIAAGGWDPTLQAGQEYGLMQGMLRQGARVAFLAEPLAVKDRRGPGSFWSAEPARARRDAVRNVWGAVQHLEAVGGLDAPRRRIAAERLLRIARWYRDYGDPYGEEVAALARGLQASVEETPPGAGQARRPAHGPPGARLRRRLRALWTRPGRPDRERPRR